MGMTATVYVVSASDMDRILAEPELVNQLWTCQMGSRDAENLPRRECDLDKAWWAIMFVLGGNSDPDPDPPADFLIAGGTPIGDITTGLGPVRYLRGDALAQIAAFLEPIDEAAFDRAFDHAALLRENIYAIGDDEAEDREYVVGGYVALRELVLSAARNGECVVLTVA